MTAEELPPPEFSDLFNTSPSSDVTGDREAIRTLVDAWGHFADRRLAAEQAALFVQGGVIRTFDGDPAAFQATAIIRGRADIESAVAALAQYDRTTHFNGQLDVAIAGDRAVGQLLCQAHHLWHENEQRMLLVMHIRYLDSMVKVDGRWLFEERKLITEWSETRESNL